MSPLLLWITLLLLAVPIAFLYAAINAPQPIGASSAVILFFLVSIYASVWSIGRPAAFLVSSQGLEIIWPLRRRFISREHLSGAETIDLAALKQEFGIILRVGAGGLWGGFGLAWSSKGKHLSLYVSRHKDGFVLVRAGGGVRPLLLTPARPREFAAAAADLWANRERLSR